MKTVSMYWLFLSQREYNRSGHLHKNCNSKQITGGSRARIQLTVLLVSFECCSPFGEIMLGGKCLSTAYGTDHRSLSERSTSEVLV